MNSIDNKVKTLISITICLALIGVSATAVAAKWERIETFDNSFTAYIDVTSIVSDGEMTKAWIEKYDRAFSHPHMNGTTSITRDKDLIKAWVKYQYASPQKGGPFTGSQPYRSQLLLVYFDCSSRRWEPTSKAMFYKDADPVEPSLGSLASVDGLASFFQEVAPGTVGESALGRACLK